MGVVLVREEVEVCGGSGEIGDDVVVLGRGLTLSARRRGSHRTVNGRLGSGRAHSQSHKKRVDHRTAAELSRTLRGGTSEHTS